VELHGELRVIAAQLPSGAPHQKIINSLIATNRRQIDADQKNRFLVNDKMAGIRPIALSYQELYGEPANDPFGSSEEGNEDCCRAVYNVWRTTADPLEVKTLLQNVLADFSRPIGCVVTPVR
jgi:hypothetical protein